MNVAIVIFTRNRVNLLRRTFQYYLLSRMPVTVVIGDSSDEADALRLDSLADEYSGSLDIRIKHYDSDCDPWVKILESINSCEFEYIVLSGDDDLLMACGIEQCYEFLSRNPDFSVASGREVRIANRGEQIATNWLFSGILHNQPTIDNDDSLLRLVAHFRTFWPTFYSVHRRDSLIQAITLAQRMNAEALFGELMQSAASVLSGKYKCIESIFIIRQVYHGQSVNFNVWEEVISDADFNRQLEYFKISVADLSGLAQEGISAAVEAIRVFLRQSVSRSAFAKFESEPNEGPGFSERGVVEAGRTDSKGLDDVVGQHAVVVNPMEIFRFGSDLERPFFLAAVNSITSWPDGIPLGISKLGECESMPIGICSKGLLGLICSLQFSGYGGYLMTCLSSCIEESAFLSYAEAEIILSANHFELPGMIGLISVVNSAKFLKWSVPLEGMEIKFVGEEYAQYSSVFDGCDISRLSNVDSFCDFLLGGRLSEAIDFATEILLGCRVNATPDDLDEITFWSLLISAGARELELGVGVSELVELIEAFPSGGSASAGVLLEFAQRGAPIPEVDIFKVIDSDPLKLSSYCGTATSSVRSALLIEVATELRLRSRAIESASVLREALNELKSIEESVGLQRLDARGHFELAYALWVQIGFRNSRWYSVGGAMLRRELRKESSIAISKLSKLYSDSHWMVAAARRLAKD